MIHAIKFGISAAFLLLGIWAFMKLSFWTGIAAFLFISIAGHGLAVLIFKRFATKEQLSEDLRNRVDNEWDMNQ